MKSFDLMFSLTSTVPKQELRSSCLISWVVDHHRVGDYPMNGDHSRRVNPNSHREGGRNHHPPSENRIFSTTEHPADSRPVCKLKFVRCGPGEKTQSTLSFSVEAWWPDKVQEHLFPNSEIEIFIDFWRFSTNFPNFEKILSGPA